MISLPIIYQNQCGECTKCCEGWLSAKIHEKILSPGNSCEYIKNNSCSIYNNRPIKPCRTFNCLWITQNMPESLKPSTIGIIVVQNIIDKIPYTFLVNAPNYPSNELLKWLAQNSNNKNLVYFNEQDEIILLGSSNFLNAIYSKKDIILDQHFKLKEYYKKD